MGVKYYLAVDIGASSGRHILSHIENGEIILEEVYRFWNGSDMWNGHRIWDTERLFREVVAGMKKCAEVGKIPSSMGIDTWAVDYVLLDKDDRMIGPCWSYRDNRTDGVDEEVYKIIPRRELYARTGIQKAIFNSIYQLMATKIENPEALNRAKSFLMVPDYLNFLLTGVKKQEYTNATTTQLVTPSTKTWDMELIEKLGYPKRLFGELSKPGSVVGTLKDSVKREVGYDLTVVLPATHDTGSAVLSVPSNREHTLYISSGTWSLMGCETKYANTGEEAEKANFTNEGGYDYRYRFLKNIMGLWMIQSVKKELEAGYEFPGKEKNDDYGFGELCERASQETINSIVDVNADRFLAPQSMIAEIQAACRESGQEVPVTAWQIARVIYRSLAECYRKTANEIETLNGRTYDTIHIIGGGSNAVWLNHLTADFTKKRVLAGPGEATAIGNLGAQMIRDGAFSDRTAFRSAVYASFGVKEYLPKET